MTDKCKKRGWPCVSRQDKLEVLKSRKNIKTRRSNRKNKTKESAILNIMYANIQGFTGKRTSLQYTMNAVKADVVSLAETMTRKPVLERFPNRTEQHVSYFPQNRIS